MPVYEFSCECGDKEDIVLAIKNRNNPIHCNTCGKRMERIICCKIERLEPTYLAEMSQQLPPSERAKVYDKISFKQALERSGLVTI